MSNNYIGGQAYTGTRSDSPPNWTFASRPPTQYDINCRIGDLWMDQTLGNAWVLISLKGKPASRGMLATWEPLYINVAGGANINTTGVIATHTVTVALDDVINLPNTNAAGTAGIIQFGGNNWIHNYGLANTFVGIGAGNQTLNPALGTYNVGIGFSALNNITTGTTNVCIGAGAAQDSTAAYGMVAIGSESGRFMTTGSENVFLGIFSGRNVLTGSNNICIGRNAGTQYIGAESTNIAISSIGVTGENNAIHIADLAPTAATSCFVGGINGITTTAHAAKPVFVSATGQLGTDSGVAFSAYLAATVNNVTGNGTNYTVIFDTEIYDLFGYFNLATSIFTAPVSGKYLFTVGITLNALGVAHTSGNVELVTTAATYALAMGNYANFADSNTNYTANGSVITHLAVGQTAYVSAVIFNGAQTVNILGAAPAVTYFSGQLIS